MFNIKYVLNTKEILEEKTKKHLTKNNNAVIVLRVVTKNDKQVKRDFRFTKKKI